MDISNIWNTENTEEIDMHDILGEESNWALVEDLFLLKYTNLKRAGGILWGWMPKESILYSDMNFCTRVKWKVQIQSDLSVSDPGGSIFLFPNNSTKFSKLSTDYGQTLRGDFSFLYLLWNFHDSILSTFLFFSLTDSSHTLLCLQSASLADSKIHVHNPEHSGVAPGNFCTILNDVST